MEVFRKLTAQIHTVSARSCGVSGTTGGQLTPTPVTERQRQYLPRRCYLIGQIGLIPHLATRCIQDPWQCVCLVLTETFCSPVSYL